MARRRGPRIPTGAFNWSPYKEMKSRTAKKTSNGMIKVNAYTTTAGRQVKSYTRGAAAVKAGMTREQRVGRILGTLSHRATQAIRHGASGAKSYNHARNRYIKISDKFLVKGLRWT